MGIAFGGSSGSQGLASRTKPLAQCERFDQPGGILSVVTGRLERRDKGADDVNGGEEPLSAGAVWSCGRSRGLSWSRGLRSPPRRVGLLPGGQGPRCRHPTIKPPGCIRVRINRGPSGADWLDEGHQNRKLTPWPLRRWVAAPDRSRIGRRRRPDRSRPRRCPRARRSPAVV